MTKVAVVAHTRKQLDGGLNDLRDTLRLSGVDDPLWYEVKKSKKAAKRARQAVAAGADLVFVWGGDGTVQRCIDALAGSACEVAILPAGTANLLAHNLGIPVDLEQAVDVGLHGTIRTLDTATANGEHFAVMAGAGLDARMIRDADSGLKDRFGRAAYVYTAAKNVFASRVGMKVVVDGSTWFEGQASCVLVGNVGSVFGGITVFDDAEPDSGRLEVGVVTAETPWQWARALSRVALGRADRSPLVRVTSARRIDIRFETRVPYEIDGGDRKPVKRLRIDVEPASIHIRVPEASS